MKYSLVRIIFKNGIFISSLLILFLIVSNINATIYTVNSSDDTNTGVGNSGTLRYCIITANAANTGAPHTITFNIPGSEPFIISLNSDLPAVSRAGTIIDASTQPGFAPDNIPVVYIDGTNNCAYGIYVDNVPNVEIYGFQIYNCDYGIYIFGDLADNFKIGAPGKKNVINQCNKYMICLESADNGYIKSNNLGCDLTGSFGYVPPQTYIMPSGLYLINGADNNTIGGSLPSEGNIIAGSTSSAVHIGEYSTANPETGSSNNVFYGNTIGGTGSYMAWYCWAFWIDGNSDNNIIGGILTGQGNNMTNATDGSCGNGYGNLVVGINGPDASGNQVRGNNMSCAFGNGIILASSGNNNIAEPVITGQTGNNLNGTAPPNATIDIYTGSLCNSVYGRCKSEKFITKTLSDASGNWSIDLSNFGLACNTSVTVVATTMADGSSQFADCYAYCPVPTYCDNTGNVMLYSNYDGGTLIINIDADIPNLKIGIVSFEPDSIILQGAYLNNVTAVEWAGVNSFNNHCPGLSPKTSVITDSPVVPVISISPPVTLNSPHGVNSGIYCNYSCDTTTWQGGCNTYDQINDYFFNKFGSNKLLFHYTQYGCWKGVQSLSAGGQCCSSPTNSDLTASIKSQTDVVCNGGNTGNATVIASGGTTPYTYLWSDGQTTETASGLTAGNYTVTVTDFANNPIVLNVTIKEALAIIINTKIINEVSCFGGNNGSAVIIASGGTGSLTYSWNTNPVQKNDTVKNLSAGLYNYTVTDSLGCIKTSTITINQAAEIISNITVINEISCFGDKNGIAVINAIGGTGSLSYSWDTSPVQKNDTIKNLNAGNYTCTITDSLSCIKTATIIISQPAEILLDSTAVDADCGKANGSASIDVISGGTPPFYYSWNATPDSKLATQNSIIAGKYKVTVTDKNACIKTATVTVESNNNVYNAGLSNITINYGDTTSLIVSVDKAMTFNWTPVSGLSCTSCKSPNASPDVTTTYSVIVTDSNGCVYKGSLTVNVEIKCGDIFIPNALSPNGIYEEDKYIKVYINEPCVSELNFIIYDRWGEKVFETNNTTDRWYGINTSNNKKLDSGVFVYYLEATLSSGVKINKKGNISLIR